MYSAKLAKQKSTTTKMSVAIAGLAVSLTAILACAGAFVGINFDSTKTLLNGGKVYYEKDINYLKDSAKSGAEQSYKNGYTEGKDSQAGAITDAHQNGYTEGVNSQTGAITDAHKNGFTEGVNSQAGAITDAHKNGFTEGVNSQAGAITDAHNNGYTEGVNSQTGAITDAHNNGFTEGVNSQKDKINSAFADGNAAGIAQAKLINVGDYIDGFFYNPNATFNLDALDWSNPHAKFTTKEQYPLIGHEGNKITAVDIIYLVADFELPTPDEFLKNNHIGASIGLQVMKLTVDNKICYALAQNGSHGIAMSGNSAAINLVFNTSLTGDNVSFFYNPEYGKGKKDMLDFSKYGIVAYVNPQVDIWGNWVSKNPFKA